jgi:hypothetical protein
MTLHDLAPSARDAAITGFVADVLSLAEHVLREDADYPADTRIMDALVASLEQRCLPPVQPVLATVVAWVLFITEWNHRFRVLTEEELRIRAVAWRLSDAIYGPRHH